MAFKLQRTIPKRTIQCKLFSIQSFFDNPKLFLIFETLPAAIFADKTPFYPDLEKRGGNIQFLRHCRFRQCYFLPTV